jgi:hypothetical protein
MHAKTKDRCVRAAFGTPRVITRSAAEEDVCPKGLPRGQLSDGALCECTVGVSGGGDSNAQNISAGVLRAFRK